MKKGKKAGIFLLILFCLLSMTACAADSSSKDAGSAAVTGGAGEGSISDSAQGGAAGLPNDPGSGESDLEDIPPYVSIVQISVNPLIWVYLDEANVVVKCEALNADAKDVLSSMENTEEEFDWFVLHFLDCCAEKGYLRDEGTIEVTVVEVRENSPLDAEGIVQNTNLRCSEVLEGRHLDCEVSVQDASGDGVPPQKPVWDETSQAQNQPEVCDNCGGTGEIVCDLCRDGDPICDLCLGEGQREDPCPVCQGETVVVCDRCDGAGQVPEQTIIYECGICKGSGTRWVVPADHDVKPGANDRTDGVTSSDAGGYWDTCDLCHGKGTMSHYDPAGPCPDCEGEGTRPCEHCEMTGIEIIFCERCNGTGKLDVCHRCGGSGVLKCEMCQ